MAYSGQRNISCEKVSGKHSCWKIFQRRVTAYMGDH